MLRRVDGQNCSDMLDDLTSIMEAAELFEATQSEREYPSGLEANVYGYNFRISNFLRC
jgi:hypothetical protein